LRSNPIAAPATAASSALFMAAKESASRYEQERQQQTARVQQIVRV
jgi:hypothetical protein